MFKNCITSTPFTTGVANSCFQNISGSSYRGDVTFISTLRALIAPRIGENENVELTFGATDYTGTTIQSVPPERTVAAICSNYSMDAPGQLVIHSFASDADSNLVNMQIVEDKFTSVYPEYHRLDKVKAFYRKSFNVDCYINPDKKSVIVFVDRLDIKKVHYLQVSTLAFMPWYLNQNDGLTADELALMQSLRETSSEKYMECIARIAEKYDFRSAKIRKLLSGFETRYECIERDKTRQEIEGLDDEINRLNDVIGDYLTKRNEKCIQLLGLEQKIAGDTGDSEIMEYFLCNRRLVLTGMSDTEMYFSVKDYLDYFDRDMAERVINNRDSYVYDRGNGRTRTDAAVEKMKKLMTELFVSESPRLRVRVCAAYKFNLNGSVHAQSGDFSDCEYNGYLPNPHINRYHCMGNYIRTINDLLKSRNYIGAVEQCIASCKSLNFGDSAVMYEFMRQMWANEMKFIELPDGNVVRPNEAISWLEAQEEQCEQAEEA